MTSVEFWCKVLRPGCRQQVPWDPAAWESAWMEMSQPHSRQRSSLFLAWLALQPHNKKDMPKNEMREAKGELEKDRFPSS